MKNSIKALEIQSVKATADMPPYMRKDSHGYKFVRPIPKKLHSIFNKANFIQRLGKNFSEAKRRCLELAVETQKKLDQALHKASSASSIDDYLCLPPSARLQRIKFSPNLAGSISSLWLQSLDADAQARASGERSDEELESLEENIPQMTAMIRQALATGRVDAFHNAVHQLLMFKGYELDASADEWQQLTSNVLKSFLIGYKTLAARQ